MKIENKHLSIYLTLKVQSTCPVMECWYKMVIQLHVFITYNLKMIDGFLSFTIQYKKTSVMSKFDIF